VNALQSWAVNSKMNMKVPCSCSYS